MKPIEVAQKVVQERARNRAKALVGTSYGHWQFVDYKKTVQYGRFRWCVKGVCVCGKKRTFPMGAHMRSLSCGCQIDAGEGRESEGARRIEQRRVTDLPYYLYELARKRADVRLGRVPFEIEYKDVEIPKECPILGIKFDRQPVLTVLDPSLGYVQGNLLVISDQAHQLRLQDCVKYLKWVREKGLTQEYLRAKQALLEGPLPRKTRGEEVPELVRPTPKLPELGDYFRHRETLEIHTVSRIDKGLITFRGGLRVSPNKLDLKFEPAEAPPPSPPVPEVDLVLVESKVRLKIEETWERFYHVRRIPKGWNRRDWLQHSESMSYAISSFIAGKITFDKLPYNVLGVFGVRTTGALDRLGIETVSQLVKTSRRTLMNERNFGRGSLNEIVKILKNYDLGLAPERQIP